MKIKMRDGSFVNDSRLGRLIHFDDKSKEYPIRTLVKNKKPRTYTWRCTKVLDQGTEGACAGFAVSHEAIARPAEVLWINNSYALQHYYDAQHIDPWSGGAYPGAEYQYEGTTVLAALKIGKQYNYYDHFRWAFTFNDFILGLGYHGPAVIGVNWMEGMFNPDKSGFIHATGNVMGGHAILVNGVDVKYEFVRLHNSWGTDWGVNGTCKMKFEDMEFLLSNNGEAAFCMKRHSKP